MKAVSIVAKGSYHIGGKKVTIQGSAPVQTRFWPGGPPVTGGPHTVWGLRLVFHMKGAGLTIVNMISL